MPFILNRIAARKIIYSSHWFVIILLLLKKVFIICNCSVLIRLKYFFFSLLSMILWTFIHLVHTCLSFWKFLVLRWCGFCSKKPIAFSLTPPIISIISSMHLKKKLYQRIFVSCFIFKHICVYKYYIYIYIYIHTIWIYINFIYTHTHTHIYIYVYICMNMYIYIYNIYIHIYI